MGEWQQVFQSNIACYVRLISQNYLLRSGWESVAAETVLTKNSLHVKGAVQAKDYRKSGLFPIVSQSKDLISGFTDRSELLVEDVPVVLFGDHTQTVKYVDFPFVVGADGVKLLTTQPSYDPHFFYYLLRSIDLNSNKYARHFSLLRKSLIPFKDDALDMQAIIVRFLVDFENETLKETVYFDREVEQSILNLHLTQLKSEGIATEAGVQAQLIKQLRETVLQEAVAGKLTAGWRKQHPVVKGEPQYDAVELLAQIKAEKERLVKDGKIRKESLLPPITDEDKPFNLPEGWVWCRLGEVADGFQYGSSVKSLKEGKVPVLRMGNIQCGKIDWNGLVYTNDPEEMKKYRLTEGDLLFNRTNSRELVGKTGLFDGQHEAIFAGYLVRVGMLGEISPTYSNFVLNSKLHRRWCDENKTDALGQSNINATKLRDFLFPLPPLAEQQAIIDRTNSLMATIEELDNQVAERKGQAQLLMQTVLREAFNVGQQAGTVIS